MNAVSENLLAGIALVSTISTDADLIAACAEFAQIEMEYQAQHKELGDDESKNALCDRFFEKGTPSFARILASTPPTNLAGLRALVDAIVAENPDILKGRNGRSDLLVAHLVKGLLQVTSMEGATTLPVGGGSISNATDDPAIVLWNKICSMQAELDAACAEHTATKISKPNSRSQKALLRRCDDLGDELTQLETVEINRVVPTTLAGLRAKASNAMKLLLGNKGLLREAGWLSDVLVSVLKDTTEFSGSPAPAAPLESPVGGETDAALLDLCAEYQRLQSIADDAERTKTYKGQPIEDSDEGWQRIEDEVCAPASALIRSISETSAVTAAGLLAKASAVQRYVRLDTPEPDGDLTEFAMWSVLSDRTAGNAEAVISDRTTAAQNQSPQWADAAAGPLNGELARLNADMINAAAEEASAWEAVSAEEMEDHNCPAQQHVNELTDTVMKLAERIAGVRGTSFADIMVKVRALLAVTCWEDAPVIAPNNFIFSDREVATEDRVIASIIADLATMERGAAGGLVAAVASAEAHASHASLPGTESLSAHPDAELLALDAEARPLLEAYVANQQEFFALPDDSLRVNIVGDEADQIYDRVAEISDKMLPLRPKTLGGVIAKARMLRHWLFLEYQDKASVDFHLAPAEASFGWSFANDLIAMGRTTGQASSSVAPVAPEDPVVALYQEYLERKKDEAAADSIYVALTKAHFIPKYGKDVSSAIWAQWQRDPRFPVLATLRDAASEAFDRLADATNAIMESVPTTALGLQGKVQVVLDQYPSDDDWRDEITMKVLREVALWLDAPATPKPLVDSPPCGSGVDQAVILPPASNPDGKLIQACQAFRTACSDLHQINAKGDATDEEIKPIIQAWGVPIDAVTDTPATTWRGVKAKALATIGLFRTDNDSSYVADPSSVHNEPSLHERMAWHLLHEIIAMPLPSDCPEAQPNGQMIQAGYAIGPICAAYMAAAPETAEKEALGKEYDHFADVVCSTRATTYPCIMAKAQAAYDRSRQEGIDRSDFAALDGIGPLLCWDVVNDLLAMGGRTAAAPMVEQAAPVHPDAELIAACNEYLRIQRAFEAAYDALPGDMERGDPAIAMLDQIPELGERIVALRASTAEGYLARARCMAFFYMPGNEVCRDDLHGSWEDRFQAAGYRDLIAMGRA